MKILTCDPKWLDIPAEVWLAAFSKRAKENLDPAVADIVLELQEHFPQPGVPTHAPVPVILRKGRSIAPHRHPEHLIIYYPIGHPCKLLALGDEFTPVKNSAVYLPPDALHSVQANKNKKPRLSLALRWSTDVHSIAENHGN